MILNGRFLQQRTTGVQRFAREIVTALDSLLDERALGCSLLTPRSVQSQTYRNICVRAVGRFSGQAWEQFELSHFAGNDLLINLGNAAPLLRRHQAVVLHDAGVWAAATSYKPLFREWARLQQRTLVAAGAKILTVSEFSRRELATYLSVEPARIDVLSEGCDHILRVASNDHIIHHLGLADRPFCLAVGSLAPHKNFGALEETARSLAATGGRLVIVGQPNEHLFSREAAAFRSAIIYAGPVTDGELRALYERASVFVFPSFYEGFGLPAVEAMICGCPVVAANAGSLPEVCADAALYADARNPRDIARQVLSVLSTSELASMLREKGKIRAGQFTWRRAAENLLTSALRYSV
jgi:glycosyltransferase involved in cell wall biosynthesis